MLSLPTKASSRWALGARWLLGRYERFLQRSFPRLYALHSAFTAGNDALWGGGSEGRGLQDPRYQLGSPSPPRDWLAPPPQIPDVGPNLLSETSRYCLWTPARTPGVS